MKVSLWRRFFAIVLCAIMLVSVLFSFVRTSTADEASDQTETIDYILILDCTVRAVNADQDGIRKAAAKMFVDLIPVDNARVAVFKIGDRDMNAYNLRPDLAKSYQLRKDDNHVANASYRMQCIYQLWDFDRPVSTISQREELKAIIDKAYIQSTGGFSDTHCAVYSAIDTLKYWDSKNACILLVSEEFAAAYNEHLVYDANGGTGQGDHSMWDDVEAALDAHDGWIMNWVDLGNGTPEIREKIDYICRKYNKGETCFDFSIAQLPQMIATIVSKYTGSNEKEGVIHKLDSSGTASIGLPDFVMLTEANVVVTGDGLESVTVTDGQGAKIEKPKDDIWFSMNYDPQNRARFLYSAIKMIRPSSGAWTVNVKGKPGTQVYVQAIHTLEPDIKLTCHYDTDANGLIGVGSKLQFVAVYQYAGEDLYCGSAAYKHYLPGAKLYYTHSSNPDKKVDISDTLKVEGEQYVSEFAVTMRGTYTFYFYVASNDFKSGMRSSNPIENITVANHSPKAKGSIEDIGTVAVGTHLEAVRNIAEHFSDEYKEPLTYRFECKYNKRNVDEKDAFWKLTNDGFLSITAPGMAGEYVFNVFAEDSNGAQSEPISFKLNATNEPPQLTEKSPIKVKLVANAPKLLKSTGLLPKEQCADYSIKLDKVFTDPEGLPLDYVIDSSKASDKNGEPIVSAKYDKTSETFVASALRKGKATVIVTAVDSSNTTETVEFQINVRKAGNALFGRYWWFLLLTVIVLLALIALILSRRVRGSWNITVDDIENKSGCSHSFTSLPSSRDQQLKKTKVSLLAIVKCAVRKEDCLGDVQTNPLKDRVVVFQGALSLGKGVAFKFTPTARTVISIDDTVLTKAGKYILKKNQILSAECKDVDDSSVLNVQASFH